MLLWIIHFCFKQYFKTVIVKKAISYKSEFGEEKNQSNRILGRECKEMSVWCLFRKPSISFFKKEKKKSNINALLDMAWEDIFTCVRTCPSILLDKVFVFSQLDSNLDLLKFKYSEKATKIRKKISQFYMTLLSKLKKRWQIFFSNFC